MNTGMEEITLNRLSGNRLELWTAALEDFDKSPWVGSGVKMLDFFGFEVYMHNGYLDILFIVGICGFALFTYGLLYWFIKVLYSLKYPSTLLIQTICFAYIIGIIMFNLGGTSRLFPGVTYFIGLIFGISLQIAVAQTEPSKEKIVQQVPVINNFIPENI